MHRTRAAETFAGLKASSRARLTLRHVERFPRDTLFDNLARAVCAAECLPRKELFEAWEMARRVRRRMRGGTVVDIAAGHGLLGWALMLLDDTSPAAILADTRQPESAERLRLALERRWPRLAGRVCYVEVAAAEIEPPPDALLVSCHGCGALTDTVIDHAVRHRTPLAVLPCCQGSDQDSGGLDGWLPIDVAVDVTRVARLREAGFRVWTQQLPPEITPKNRLLLAATRSDLIRPQG